MVEAIQVREYVNRRGVSRFRTWFRGLDPSAAVRVTIALERIAQGHRSAMKGVGEGVMEYRIDAGPGYRIYFGQDGERLVILLAGGTKRRQDRDIAEAKTAWQEYRQRRIDGE